MAADAAGAIWRMDLRDFIPGDFCGNRLSVHVLPARRQPADRCRRLMLHHGRRASALHVQPAVCGFGAGLYRQLLYRQPAGAEIFQ